MAILPRFYPRGDDQKEADTERQLIAFESKLGRHIFGPIPKNHNRDFFCLDPHTWVWHEDWFDSKGNRKVVSTRYLIRRAGVIKSQNGGAYKSLDGQESENLYRAIKKYIGLVQTKYDKVLSA